MRLTEPWSMWLTVFTFSAQPEQNFYKLRHYSEQKSYIEPYDPATMDSLST